MAINGRAKQDEDEGTDEFGRRFTKECPWFEVQFA